MVMPKFVDEIEPCTRQGPKSAANCDEAIELKPYRTAADMERGASRTAVILSGDGCRPASRES
jgi:hypothetical protein